MIAALREAGFPGVEAAEGVIYARLSASGAEFTAVAEAGSWRLALCWPVRATAAQMAGFMAAHPGAEMDLFLGETRLSMLCGPATWRAGRRWPRPRWS